MHTAAVFGNDATGATVAEVASVSLNRFGSVMTESVHFEGYGTYPQEACKQLKCQSLSQNNGSAVWLPQKGEPYVCNYNETARTCRKIEIQEDVGSEADRIEGEPQFVRYIMKNANTMYALSLTSTTFGLIAAQLYIIQSVGQGYLYHVIGVHILDQNSQYALEVLDQDILSLHSPDHTQVILMKLHEDWDSAVGSSHSSYHTYLVDWSDAGGSLELQGACPGPDKVVYDHSKAALYIYCFGGTTLLHVTAAYFQDSNLINYPEIKNISLDVLSSIPYLILHVEHVFTTNEIVYLLVHPYTYEVVLKVLPEIGASQSTNIIHTGIRLMSNSSNAFCSTGTDHLYIIGSSELYEHALSLYKLQISTMNWTRLRDMEKGTALLTCSEESVLYVSEDTPLRHQVEMYSLTLNVSVPTEVVETSLPILLQLPVSYQDKPTTTPKPIPKPNVNQDSATSNIPSIISIFLGTVIGCIIVLLITVSVIVKTRPCCLIRKRRNVKMVSQEISTRSSSHEELSMGSRRYRVSPERSFSGSEHDSNDVLVSPPTFLGDGSSGTDTFGSPQPETVESHIDAYTTQSDSILTGHQFQDMAF